MKKFALFGLFVCLFSIVLASSVYAIDFKSADAPTANDTKAIQGLNEKGSSDTKVIQGLNENSSSSLGGSGAKK